MQNPITEYTLKLARVADLAGVDINGLRADVRSRTADGEVMYDHQKDSPRMVTMRCVRFLDEKLCPTLQRACGKERGRWMRWEWEKNTDAIAFDCGYSGHWAEDGAHLEYHIMLEVRP